MSAGRLAFLFATCLVASCARRHAAMVEVPAASFRMGCEAARDPGCTDEERPSHTVTVRRFRIDRTEVTREAYAACAGAGACAAPLGDFQPTAGPRRPVTDVTWAQAAAYCHWAGERLPSEAEWELAARGTDGRVYPWGDAPPDCQRARTQSCGVGTVDVGTLPRGASPFGVLDLAGNADEWVEDLYASYGDGGPSPSGERVAKGGAYDAWHSRSSCRNALSPDHHDFLLGFRCASSD